MSTSTILTQRHPEVVKYAPAWERIRALLEEDESCYSSAEFFIPFPNESTAQKTARLQAFIMGFYNPSQDLVSAKGDYILRRQVDRDSDNELVNRFFDRADKSGQSLGEFVKNEASPILSAYGTVFGVVDKPRGPFLTRAEELQNGMAYLHILHPTQVLNWVWEKSGAIKWFRYWQYKADYEPSEFEDTTTIQKEYVTWTRTEFIRHDEGGVEIERVPHGFGVVPVAVQAGFTPDPRWTLGKSTFFSSSRQIILGNNHLSAANVEVFKYSSVLIMNRDDYDQNITIRPTVDEGDGKVVDVTTRAAKTRDLMVVDSVSEAPRYLVKDLEGVDKATEKALWYFRMAADAEASGKTPMPLSGDAAVAQPQSGVAKAYDFQDMDANLFAHAMDLQNFERQVTELFCRAMGIAGNPFSIRYPTNFDTRSFEEKIKQVAGLRNIAFPSDTGMRAAYGNLAVEITAAPEQIEVIKKEIETYERDDGATGGDSGGDSGESEHDDTRDLP